MKKTLLSLLLGVTAIGSAQITTNSNYTPEQLVNDVLLAPSSSIVIFNVTSTSGADFGSSNSLGYFNSNNSDFMFEDGIILSTGDIADAPGPNITNQSAGNWPGDTTIQTVINENGGGTAQNATILEFNFVSTQPEFSLTYLFASEEYGANQCNDSDLIAITITDETLTPMFSNLAVIPGTVIPVSVTAIRDAQYNSGCESENPEFFDEFHTSTNPLAPINFNGTTVPMEASATIVPGNIYHLKIVIADRNDTANDSALFILGGSLTSNDFNFNLDIGTPQALEMCNNNNSSVAIFDLTYNDSVLLQNLNPADYTVTYHETMSMAENNESPIQNSQTYPNVEALTSEGIQIVYARVTSNSDPTIYAVAPFALVVKATPVAGAAEPIAVLDNNIDLYTTVDLTTKEGEILNGLSSSGFTIWYYTTEEDAATAVNPIADATAYNTTSTTVYFRLENNDTGCFTIGSFDVVVLPADYETPPPAGDAVQTFIEGETLADLEVEGENIQWYASQSSDAGRSDDIPLPLTTLLVDNTTYFASQTVYSIESEERTPVTVNAVLRTAEQAFAGLKYYPNPVKNILTISNNENITGITVFNLLGQSLLNKDLASQTAEINLSSLPVGMYIIKVISAEKEKTLRVTKN